MEQVRLGIIGVGNMGSGHTANIMAGKVPEVRITAAADLRESRREWAKENMPEGTAIFEDGDSLIKSGTCDAVLIAVPHYCLLYTSGYIPIWHCCFQISVKQQ